VDVAFADYLAWAKAEGQNQPFTKAVFGKHLRAAVPGVQHKRRQTAAGSEHWYLGLRPRLKELDGGDAVYPIHVAKAGVESVTDLTRFGISVSCRQNGDGAALPQPRTPAGLGDDHW
jgi:phage/plasmid-associated DNA primase